MKRLTLISVLMTAFAAGSVAAPVSRESAGKQAEKFLAERFGIHVRALSVPHQEQAASITHLPYYIFNLPEGGYVVVSGDDASPAILAYSLTGSMDPSDMPEGCAEWLAQSLAENESTVYSEAVEPLIQTKWDQRYPYYSECPTTANGLRCLTGCVATAMSQVMRYYNWPARGTGSIIYQDNIQNEERSFDFSSMPFDWANMMLTYDYGSSAESCDAVAGLMKAVGHSVKMQYSPDVSTAQHRATAEALRMYFDYDPGIHYYKRDLMSQEEWENILLGELKAGRPVLYDGRNSKGGHTFICDGYDGQGMYHINWGWGGKSDGYFFPASLNPGDQGAGSSDGGYNQGQAMICHIIPSGYAASEPQTDYLLSINKLYFSEGGSGYKDADEGDFSTTLGKAMITFHCWNNGLDDFSGEMCAALLSADNGIEPVSTGWFRDNISLIVPMNYKQVTFQLPETLGQGTHTIGFFYRKDNSDTWHRVVSASGVPSMCDADVQGNKVILRGRTELPEGWTGINCPDQEKETRIMGYEVRDLNGRTVIRCAGQPSLSGLPKGIYILTIKTDNGQKSSKIVI